MTLREQVISGLDDKNSLSSMGGSDRPRVVVFFNLLNAGYTVPDPFQKEGMNSLGRAISIPDFAKEKNDEVIKTGAVKGHQYTIPLESSRDLVFTFDRFKLLASWLSLGTDVALVYNYAASGQTTISSASRTGGTVAAATGLAKKNLIIVDTRHATYGGFPEATIIKSISGTAVTFDPPLDHIPANGTTFKKIGGKADGTNKTDMGIVYPDTVDVEYPRGFLVIDEFFPGNGSKFTRWYPEVEILPGVQQSSGNAKTVSVTFRPIQQAEETFTLIDGATESRPFYGKGQWVPLT